MSLPVFQNHLDGIRSQVTAQGTASALPGVTARSWNLPTSLSPGSADIQSPVVLIDACSRLSLNSMAIAGYQGDTPNSFDGRLGKIMAAKMAIDHMGAYERALHARYASPVRCRIWAGTRRTGHGDDTYGVFARLEKAVNSMLEEATAKPNTPTE